MKKVILIIVVVVLLGIGIYLYQTKFRTYSVVFNTGLGAGYKTQEVKVGASATNPGTPSASGYKFIGWYLDDSEYDFNSKVTKNITITAKWEKVSE